MKNNFTLLVPAGFVNIQSMMKLSAATLAFLKVCMLKIPAQTILFLCSEKTNQDVSAAEESRTKLSRGTFVFCSDLLQCVRLD